MSDQPENPKQMHEPSGEKGTAPTPQPGSASEQGVIRLRFHHHVWRISKHVIAGICLLVLVLIAAAVWYTTTSDFEHRVRSMVITKLEDATGGRVELGAFHLHLTQLGIEIDNLTIHGKEAPGQIPYFHAAQLVAHLKIIDLFAGKIGLSYLELNHPTIHIIVHPDGSTNLPTPKNARPLNAAAISTEIFNLAINQAQVSDGVIIVNAHKYHFNVDANDLRASVSYDRLRRHYLGNFAASDIRVQHDDSHAVPSQLYIQVDAARNHLHLDHLTFISGNSHLDAEGDLSNFANPQFQMHAKGTLDLRVIQPLTGVTGIQNGVLRIQAQGSGTPSKYSIQGLAELNGLVYQPEPHQTVALSAQSQLLVTQDEIAATGFHAQFNGGGTASGSLRILHWLRNAPKVPQPKRSRHWFFLHRKHSASVTVKPEPPTEGTAHLAFTDLPLAVLMHAVAPPQYGDLGFNTAFTGNVDGHWTNSLRTLSATTTLKLAPAAGAKTGEVPVTGQIAGTYSLAAEQAQLRVLQLHTPGTQAEASGSLAISPTMRGSKITVGVTTHNLAEFDKVLAALNVKSASQAIPFDLHGSAGFHGIVTGSLTAPEVQGHVTSSNLDFAFTMPAATSIGSAHTLLTSFSADTTSQPVRHSIQIDNAQATLDYSPQRFSLSNITLHSDKAVAEGSLTIFGERIAKSRYAFNQSSAITAEATLRDATLSQLMPVLGMQLPATGTLGFQVQVSGTLGNPSAQGSLELKGGEVYGEPYSELKSDLSLSSHTLYATNILYQQQGGQVSGSANFNLDSQQFQFTLAGSNFYLARFHHFQTPKYPLGGVLDFQSQGSGTLAQPAIYASLHLAQLNFAQAATGEMDATAQLQNHNLTVDAALHLNQSLVQIQGHAQLTGDYPAQARLTITNLDLNPLAKAFHLANISSRTPINATANLQGPLREPKSLYGDITIQPVALSLANIPVQSTSSIHAALKDGTLTLDPFQFEGANVDVSAHGSVGIFDKRHPIQLRTAGAINMKVAETFSDDITSSGMIRFDVQAGGTLRHPSLNGQATIDNVNLASNQYINGLSRMNGVLDFNEGRVELRNVSAYSGGGPIRLTGFATYAAGLYVNVKAVASGVRIRYPAGVTSMVDSTLQLQGNTQNLLVSGNVQVTHFAVNSTLDLVSLVNSGSQVTLPPNPNSFANRVRLDIHVTSSPSLDFQNSFAKLAGNVNLHIRGTAAQPSVLGQITITEGQAKLAGTTYQLQRGVIYFNNPIRIEPTIDLDATTHVENYDITIGLHGTPERLRPVFRSSPPLSEQDIFSLLALGRTQEEQQIYSQEESNAGVNSTANAILGSAINATVSSRIQKLFGGGSVQINPAYVTTTGNATARLTVQQQISKNLTLTYATNLNSSAQQLIQGKIDLTPNLSVLAVRDETGVFSLIFTIRRRYK